MMPVGQTVSTSNPRSRSRSDTHVNRFVVGPDVEHRSAVLQRGLTNVQAREGFYWSATLWVTEETPVDNTIAGDRSQTPGLGESLQPFPGGLICRALEIPAGAAFPMHHTDTVDFDVIISGSIELISQAFLNSKTKVGTVG